MNIVAHCLENITAVYAICLTKIRNSIIARTVEFVGTVYQCPNISCAFGQLWCLSHFSVAVLKCGGEESLSCGSGGLELVVVRVGVHTHTHTHTHTLTHTLHGGQFGSRWQIRQPRAHILQAGSRERTSSPGSQSSPSGTHFL